MDRAQMLTRMAKALEVPLEMLAHECTHKVTFGDWTTDCDTCADECIRIVEGEATDNEPQ